MKRTARKEHKCILCKRKIIKGEEYEYQRITPWDHAVNEYFFDYKAHKNCDRVWKSDIGALYDWEFPDDKYMFLEDAEDDLNKLND